MTVARKCTLIYTQCCTFIGGAPPRSPLSREREFRMNRLVWWEGSWVSGYGLWLERLIMKEERAWIVSLPPPPPRDKSRGEGRSEKCVGEKRGGNFEGY